MIRWTISFLVIAALLAFGLIEGPAQRFAEFIAWSFCVIVLIMLIFQAPKPK